ncbi:MAG: S8 family serine peptidase, partial [Melioribacteraceae bacterium]|nr:S8 family serine peptidase [Melioribacteraceae bacterium]
MKLTLAYVFLLIFMFSTANAQNQVVEKDGVYYFADRLIIKFNRNNAKSNFGEITLSEKVAKRIAAFGIYDVKPFSKNYSKSNTSSNLDLITEAKFSSPMDPFYVSSKLSALPEIDYAEPWFLYELAYETNDPFKGNQYALNLIKASAAWDVTTGDTNVVIGIVDTGVDWDHPDLSANIWRNRGEIPNNGIDDDNNGFVDDVRGWDFGGLTGTPDNNPIEDDINSQHGTHVAGIAGAVTNNSIGISSISFKTKIMPVKTAQENIRSSEGQILIAYGYQGIEYAANNGAKVINCSWGGFGYSATAKSYID